MRKAAQDFDVSPSIFSRLIKGGESDLSPELALKLSKAFGRRLKTQFNSKDRLRLVDLCYRGLSKFFLIYPGYLDIYQPLISMMQLDH